MFSHTARRAACGAALFAFLALTADVHLHALPSSETPAASAHDACDGRAHALAENCTCTRSHRDALPAPQAGLPQAPSLFAPAKVLFETRRASARFALPQAARAPPAFVLN